MRGSVVFIPIGTIPPLISPIFDTKSISARALVQHLFRISNTRDKMANQGAGQAHTVFRILQILTLVPAWALMAAVVSWYVFPSNYPLTPTLTDIQVQQQ